MGQANGRKSIFITGAASGMGIETARLFHSNHRPMPAKAAYERPSLRAGL
jgi:NADP-dependent 3-hydroxy acid dehydrogenase YdfG